MAEKEISEGVIMECLDWAYDKAVNGLTGFDSSIDLAEDYMRDNSNLIDAANELIRWQNSKSAISGFATGFGGFTAMLVTLPANITSVLFVQVRMIAAIAYMGGYDVKDDRVKTMVYACLVENSVKEVAKNFGVKIGEKLAEKAIQNISRATVAKINQKVGVRLLTKFGSKGLINLGKAVPVLGGLIGAVVDGFSTNAIGNIARDTFLVKK